MSDDREPLRALWDAVEAPPAHRALDGEDGATRAAVAWLRGAYARVEPARAAPQRLRLAPRRALRWPRRLAFAAAAAALLLLVRAAWVAPRSALTLPAEALVPQPAAAPQVEVLASDEQRLELRSGPVRLILLHPQPRTRS